MVSFTEHTNDDASLAFDSFRSVSNEDSNCVVFSDCNGIPSQEIFIALRPTDLRSAHICSPLLEMHMNEVVVVLCLCSTKAWRRLFIFLSSS